MIKCMYVCRLNLAIYLPQARVLDFLCLSVLVLSPLPLLKNLVKRVKHLLILDKIRG